MMVRLMVLAINRVAWQLTEGALLFLGTLNSLNRVSWGWQRLYQLRDPQHLIFVLHLRRQGVDPGLSQRSLLSIHALKRLSMCFL